MATLSLGTVLAQIITVAASPVLTRLYTPADFGLAALFMAVVGSVSPAICGRFDVALVVGKTLRVSQQLLGIALISATAFSLLALFLISLFRDEVIHLFKAEALANWIFLVPLTLLATGIVTGLNYYSNRLQQYRVISHSKILGSVVGGAVSIVFGMLGWNFGLVISSTMSAVIVAVWLIYCYKSQLGRRVICWSGRKRILVQKYRDFPLLNASTALLDGITVVLPVFFLSRFFSESTVGHYALMLRIAMAPLSFLSTAVSQVNLKKVADLVHQKKPVRPYLIKISLALVAIVAPLSLFLIVFAPPIFAWIFGEKWRVAGEYLQILMPALALRFVVSTVSSTFAATGNNRLVALWKVTAFVVTFGILIIAAPRSSESEIFFVLMVTDILLYSAYYSLAWRAAGNPIGYR